MASAKAVYIVGAKSTPFCRYGGSLRAATASGAYAAAARAALRAAGLPAEHVDATVVGNMHFLSQCDGGKTARYCGLYAGAPEARPALAVSRGAGSGLQALVTAAIEIQTTDAEIVLTGGTEVMSSLPYLARGVRFGLGLASANQLQDAIDTDLDSYTGLSRRMIAETAAKAMGVTRDDADRYVLESMDKWRAAQDSELFKRLLTPVTISADGKVLLDQDEVGAVTVDRDEVTAVTADGLGKMTAIEGGAIVTDGNCAAPADGATALVLASAAAVRRRGLRPLARVSGWRAAAGPPGAGLGAAAAVSDLLAGAKVDLFELNETYAAEALAVRRALRLDPARVNAAGGALGTGAPAAAAAARMAATLAHAVSLDNLKLAVAASNCGMGQSIAVMFEGV